MTLENNLINKINKLKKNIIQMIPTSNNQTPLQDTPNGNAGVSACFSKADHQHPTPEGLIDSTWTTLTVDSNFYNYTENSTAILPLQYRKIGKTVEIIGVVGLNANLAVGEWTIGTLPSECRPTKDLSFICELHNNNNLWTCTVKTNGNITFSELKDLSSSVAVTIVYDNSTDTINLAKATTTIAGTKWVDALKINVMYLV